jgi:hypothetical protein
MSNYISANYDRFDDRAAYGAVFTGNRNAYHRGRFGEFYFLKEKAKELLTAAECNYLFNGEISNPNAWWDISHSVHTELDLQCNNFEFRINPHFDDMEKITKSQWKNMYVCLGCSFTYGVGIPSCQTWPSVIEERTGIKTLNLGVPGGSIQASYRILDSWLKHFGCAPKAVLILGWLHPRIEMLIKGTPGPGKQNYDGYGSIILHNTQSVGGSKVNHDHQKRLLAEDKTREIFRHTISNFAKLKNNYNLKMYRIDTTGMIKHLFTTPSYADKQLFQGPKRPLLRLKGVAYDMSHPSPYYMTSTALAFMRLIEEKDEFLI